MRIYAKCLPLFAFTGIIYSFSTLMIMLFVAADKAFYAIDNELNVPGHIACIIFSSIFTIIWVQVYFTLSRYVRENFPTG